MYMKTGKIWNGSSWPAFAHKRTHYWGVPKIFLDIFSNFVWDNDGVDVEGASDVNGENFGQKTDRGYCQHVYEDRKNLKRVVMSSICSQTHPLPGGTQNLGQAK